MDMGTMSMSMPSMTSAAASATSSTMAGMAGMMGSGDGAMGACQMQMTWNWFTIGACFLSTSWQISSNGMFAGSCIGVILLVMAVEFVRRAGREYDRTIVRQWKEVMMNGEKITTGNGSSTQSQVAEVEDEKTFVNKILFSPNTLTRTFKPTVFQQLIRALTYMVQLGGAYIIMLLVMYYNGYIFFCVLIGGLLGFFFFSADNIADGLHQQSADACC